jgi:hypothetical protein
MSRPGWTLHEMLISLCVMGGVFAIVAHQATTQLRLYSGIARTTVARENRQQASAIGERILWSISPQAGDLMVADDSALQLQMPIGVSVVCSSGPGTVTMVAGTSQRGNVLAAFSDMPETGDRMAALFHDSLGATWVTVRLASAPSAASCTRFAASSGWQVALIEPLELPPGAALRLMRPLRLSLYRASDSRWYLGAKEWNGAQSRFNTIQPVAGPFSSYHPDQARSGLAFLYADRNGQLLEAPVDPALVARISIHVRTHQPPDSGIVSVALRNAQ